MKQAKNGCNNEVKFQGKPVYYDYTNAESDLQILGNKLSKEEYLNSFVKPENINSLFNLMIDWELYDNGWFVNDSKNKQLLYYLCQIGTNSRKPEELNYFPKIIRSKEIKLSL